MKIIGIEFSSNYMNYAVVEETDESFVLCSASRLTLSDTRTKGSLTAFQDAVKAIFNSTRPDLIGIKEKPESGRLRAGAAALKMEGIAIANAPCDIDFVSGARVNKTDLSNDELYAYLKPALKVAVASLNKSKA